MLGLTMQNGAGQGAHPDQTEEGEHLQDFACQLAQQLAQQLKRAASTQAYVRDLFQKVRFI